MCIHKTRALLLKFLTAKGASSVALVVTNPPANAGDGRDTGSVPDLGRSPGGGNGNPFHYCCLENSMDRGAWWAIVHESQTLLAESNSLLSTSTNSQELIYVGMKSIFYNIY